MSLVSGRQCRRRALRCVTCESACIRSHHYRPALLVPCINVSAAGNRGLHQQLYFCLVPLFHSPRLLLPCSHRCFGDRRQLAAGRWDTIPRRGHKIRRPAVLEMRLSPHTHMGGCIHPLFHASVHSLLLDKPQHSARCEMKPYVFLFHRCRVLLASVRSWRHCLWEITRKFKPFPRSPYPSFPLWRFSPLQHTRVCRLPPHASEVSRGRWWFMPHHL